MSQEICSTPAVKNTQQNLLCLGGGCGHDGTKPLV